MSLLEKFGYKKDEFAIALENPELFASNSTTTKITVGTPAKIAGSINGVAIPTTILVKNANWSRLTVRDHVIRRQDSEPRISQVFGGVFNNFQADITLEVDGTEMSLFELMKQFCIESFGTSLTDDQVNKMLESNLSLNGIRNGGPLMFQQMGANPAGIAHAVEAFRTAGAIDDMKSVASSKSFNTAYKIPGDGAGLEVVSFELGTSDRSLSKTGQGFIDIVSAVTENFERVKNHKSVAKVLQDKLNASIGSMSQEAIKKAQTEIKIELDMAKDYANCWSGAARQTKIDNGRKIVENKYNAVNAPCGRWSAVVAGETIDFDVWSNSTKAPVQTAEQQISDIATAEVPF
jgi:stress-induced morphogen